MGLLRPMGLAYLSAFFGEGWLFGAVWLAVGLGGICPCTAENRRRACGGACHSADAGSFLERQEMGKKALLGTFASVLAGIFFAVSRQGLGFYFAIAAVEGALTLGISYLVQKGVVLLLEHGKAVIPSREEMLSLLLLAGAFWQGLRPCKTARSAHFCCRWHRRFSASCRKAGGDWRRCGCRCVSGASSAAFRRCRAASFRCPRFRGMLAGCMRDLGRLASALAMLLAPCIFCFT